MRIALLSLGLLASLLFAVAGRAQDDLPRRGVLGIAAVGRYSTVIVGRVISGSAAEAGGVQPGDVVVSIAGVPVRTVTDFLSDLHLPAGATVTIVFHRGNADISKTFTLPPAPKEALPGAQTIYGTVEVGDSLRRTLLTLPDGVRGRLPAVLLIGGIGCFSVDNAFDELDAYRHLTHDLTLRGFVTMRVEKSGVGDSQGAPCATVDFKTEYAGYAAALQVLKASPHVDPKRVFLLGHSIGGLVAPRLAASTTIAGVVVMDTVGIDWFSYEMINERRQAMLDHLSAQAVDADAATKEFCMHELLIAKKTSGEILRENKDCAAYAYPVADAYMQQVAAINIGAAWGAVSVPVLSIYGRSDFITSESDHERIVAIVNSKHPGNATFTPINGMDHYLAASPSQQASFDRAKGGALEATYDDELSTTIATWLLRQSGRSQE